MIIKVRFLKRIANGPVCRMQTYTLRKYKMKILRRFQQYSEVQRAFASPGALRF
jgi:hypothetical protein